jgi:hypothetical protein
MISLYDIFCICFVCFILKYFVFLGLDGVFLLALSSITHTAWHSSLIHQPLPLLANGLHKIQAFLKCPALSISIFS